MGAAGAGATGASAGGEDGGAGGGAGGAGGTAGGGAGGTGAGCADASDASPDRLQKDDTATSRRIDRIGLIPRASRRAPVPAVHCELALMVERVRGCTHA